MVAARREGKWMHYRIIEPTERHAAQIFTDLRHWLLNDPVMQRERERLVQLSCVKALTHLERAPEPIVSSSGIEAIK